MQHDHPHLRRHPSDDGFPAACGLYDPAREVDSCGVAGIVDVHGRRSHRVVADALAALRALAHRTASGREPDSGDGAGITVTVPWELNRETVALDLPAPRHYATGLCFLPRDTARRDTARRIVESLAAAEGLDVLGWRDVPVDPHGAHLGDTAERSRPHIAQLFVAPTVAHPSGHDPGIDLDRAVHPLRRRAEHECAVHGVPVYFPSLSARTIVYKGMLTVGQLPLFYPDLRDPRCVSAIALVHGRYSTNTFPAWPLAQPFRYCAHNGEINTIRGNRARMRARQPHLHAAFLRGPVHDIPICSPHMSDSASLDETLELLHLAGRTLPHAAVMMMPPAWENDPRTAGQRRAFHDFHAGLLEPWDGPACLAFTDGAVFGAVGDRNGLRPGRWWHTRDDTVIFAGEAGVLPTEPSDVIAKGRLEPGRPFVVETGPGTAGRIVPPDELLDTLAAEHPYRCWLDRGRIPFVTGRPDPEPCGERADPRARWLYGYTAEDLDETLATMATTGREPVGSMGSDIPPAMSSPRPRLLFDHVTAMFAQVTNPPLDAIRERVVTAQRHLTGPEGDLLAATPRSARRLSLDTPIPTAADLEALRHLGARHPALRATQVSATFPPDGTAAAALTGALTRLRHEAERAVDSGHGILIVTDQARDGTAVPIPSLLALATVHRHLAATGRRTRVALVVDSGDAREVHHVAALLGFGADAVCPSVAYGVVATLADDGRLGDVSAATAVRNYRTALIDGVIEVMAKCGVSTISSYIGAGTFDVIGLDPDVLGVDAAIGGTTVADVAEQARERYRMAHSPRADTAAPPSGGIHRYRRDGEPHLFTPEAVFLLQHATRTGRAEVYARYCAEIDGRSADGGTLRGLLRFHRAADPIDVVDVEPVESIVTRFATGAMSYGSISAEAHETLAVAMNRLGGRSNSGEGGEDVARLGDPLRRSAVKQVASGRFGVTAAYLADATDLQIKVAQGAKPGEGGQLPAEKVYPWIARTRCSTPGVGLISPPPHHDIYSIEDLAQLIHDLRCANPAARVHVKLVSGLGVGTIAAGVVKADADVILISGHDGGTGAALLTALHHSGLPWEIGLAETQQTLVLGGLRDRVTVQCDGGLRTGRDVVIAALLGAEEFGFATAPLVVLGCILMRVCHLDTCPVGIATQNEDLRAAFAGRAEHVESFFRFVAEDVRARLAGLGLRSIDDAVGRVDLLDPRGAGIRSAGVDLAPLLEVPRDVSGAAPHRRCLRRRARADASALDGRLLSAARSALDDGHTVRIDDVVHNTDRAVGTRVGAAVTVRRGAPGLPPDTVRIHLRGSAGQSLGAFLPRGVTVVVVGDANDYVAKGLSGGCVVVRPDPAAPFAAHTQVIAGNTVLYGATAGELYLRGRVGERFAVRNSGASAVCEGTGDHACEYMTGGRVVIAGPTGRNLAAGMSGGVVHVLDLDPECVNTGSVRMRAVDARDMQPLRVLLERHRERTGSPVAAAALRDWPCSAARFSTVTAVDEPGCSPPARAPRDGR
ncbi:glutamate synthase large subunit [Rhodococcus yananensis]|uniref:glutamate synthase large subunit n=1 Tax=Rhodococcus yananensis TaxID=2879464 RepID=UPI003EBFBA8B